MGRHNIGTADGANSTVGGHHDDRGQWRLQRSVQVGETLDIQHVDLINEQHPGDQLRDPLINISVNHLIDLPTELIGHLRLPLLFELLHHGREVLPPLRLGIGHVQVVKSDVLYDLLLLVHVTLRHRHVFLSLQIKLSGVGVGPPDALHCPAVGLNVDHVSRVDLLALQPLVNTGSQLQGLRPLCGLQANEHTRHGLAVPSRIGLLLGGQLGHFTFVDLLGLLQSQPNGLAAVGDQNLRLLHFAGVHFTTHHRAERDFGPQLLCNGEGNGRLAGPRSACHEQGPPGHLLGLDEVHHNTRSLPSLLLPDQPSGNLLSISVVLQAQALDMAVRGNTGGLSRGLDLLDLHDG
mmetsp:Transcript_35132/g.76917  ORF Transcript_35132/g.76917 Transcript_35132/m.76917 type:complete len:349 (-) Transcript_35132:43-1089(-)